MKAPKDSWFFSDSGYTRLYEFSSFTQLTRFVAELGMLCDEKAHHPTLHVEKPTRLQISFCTHDAGNAVTEKDISLAEWTENLYYLFLK